MHLNLDACALALGLLAVFVGKARTSRRDRNPELLDFCNGLSAFYLGILAYGSVFDARLFQQVFNANVVLVAGSLGYACYLNLRSIWVKGGERR
jgi:hypothetical protein